MITRYYTNIHKCSSYIQNTTLSLPYCDNNIVYFYRKYDVTGLECNDPKMSMKLVFHAIIPLPFWEWDDKSRIFMRFGHSKLGDWVVDCGQFKIARYDYHEVSQKCIHYVQSWFP